MLGKTTSPSTFDSIEMDTAAREDLEPENPVSPPGASQVADFGETDTSLSRAHDAEDETETPSMEGAKEVKCSEFADAIIAKM